MRIPMMRLLRRRRLPRFYFARSRKPLMRGQRALPMVLVIAILLLAAIVYTIARVKPMVAVLARSEAREFVINAINRAIGEEVEHGNLDYGNLVTLEKDSQGSITALVTNSAMINILQTRISNNVVEYVENVIDSDLSIPIGNAVGGVLFLGRGPRIPVKIQSVTNVETKFTNDFSTAGINQTRHKIMLEITAEVSIILPGDKESTTVSTEVAIAETVIVGVVPNVYADIGRLFE